MPARRQSASGRGDTAARRSDAWWEPLWRFGWRRRHSPNYPCFHSVAPQRSELTEEGGSADLSTKEEVVIGGSLLPFQRISKRRVVRHSDAILTYSPTRCPKGGICAGDIDSRIKIGSNQYALFPGNYSTAGSQFHIAVSCSALYTEFRQTSRPLLAAVKLDNKVINGQKLRLHRFMSH